MDANGAFSVATFDNLRDDTAKDTRYKSLVRGVKSNGGGAAGSGNSVTKQANPFMKKTKGYNLTKQGELLKTDPEAYKRLKTEAANSQN